MGECNYRQYLLYFCKIDYWMQPQHEPFTVVPQNSHSEKLHYIYTETSSKKFPLSKTDCIH